MRVFLKLGGAGKQMNKSKRKSQNAMNKLPKNNPYVVGQDSAIKKSKSSPLSFLSLSLILSTMLIFLSGLFVYKSYKEQNIIFEEKIAIEKLFSQVTNYHENIASAVQLSLSTGSAKYKQTYDIYSTPLEKAITKLKDKTIQSNTYSWDTLTEKFSDIRNTEKQAFSLIKAGNIQAATDLLFSPKYQEMKISAEEVMNLIIASTQGGLNLKVDNLTLQMNAAGFIIGTALTFLFLLTLHTNKTLNAWRNALQKSYAQIFQSKQSERNNAKLLENIKNSASDGFLILNKEGKITNTNPAIQGLSGKAEEEINGMVFSELFTPACTPLIEDEFELFAENKAFSLFQKDVTLVMKGLQENDSKTVSVSIIPVHTSETQLFQVRIKDLTSQISQQNQMVDSMKDAKYASAYLKSLLLNSPDAIIITNDIGDIELFNPAAEKLFGYSFDEIAGKKFKDLFDIGNLANNPFQQGSNVALGLNKNGDRFQITLAFSEFITDEGVFYTSFIRHGGENKWAQSSDRNLSSTTQVTNVLLVEDNPINLTLTTHVLQSLGYNVTAAEDGKSLLKFITSKMDFDSIILSTHVPDIDGFKLTRLIRNYERENKIEPNTIIGLIASIDSDTIMNCLESGMSDYCHKPLDKATLRNKITRKDKNKVQQQVNVA